MSVKPATCQIRVGLFMLIQGAELQALQRWQCRPVFHFPDRIPLCCGTKVLNSGTRIRSQRLRQLAFQPSLDGPVAVLAEELLPSARWSVT